MLINIKESKQKSKQVRFLERPTRPKDDQIA